LKNDEAIDFDALRKNFKTIRPWLLHQEGWEKSEVEDVAKRIAQAIKAGAADELRAWTCWSQDWCAVVRQAGDVCRAAERRIQSSRRSR